MEPARKRRNREHTNSRNGCAQCKARKVKCDEEKPKCRACTRRGTLCTFVSDGLHQLASAASAASFPPEQSENSSSFTPIQSEFETRPTTSNAPEAEPGPSFASTQHGSRILPPRRDISQGNGPYYRPSPLAATPSTPSLSLNMAHMELLHHFITATSHDITSEQLDHRLWHDIILQLALSHDWLMHGLLSLSALTIAHRRPGNRSIYWQRASLHHDEALRGQQLALANACQENADALFAFTFVTEITAFAMPANIEGTLGRPLQRIQTCLQTLRGIRGIEPAVTQFATSGPLGGLLSLHSGNVRSSPSFKDVNTETHFSKLLIYASTNADSNRDHEINDIETYAAAASSLRATFLRLEVIPEGDPIAPSQWHWASRLSNSFVTRLSEEHSVPLILVAHWCVYLGSVRQSWWIRDWVDDAMSAIEICLPPEHLDWLEWPKQRLRDSQVIQR